MLKAFSFPWGKERIHGTEMLSMLLQPGYHVLHVLQSFVNECGTRRMGSNFYQLPKLSSTSLTSIFFVEGWIIYIGTQQSDSYREGVRFSSHRNKLPGFSHNECSHCTKTLRPLHIHQPIHGIQRVWLKILDPRKMDDKNYQTRSQICGSKLVPIKFGDCHLSLFKSVVPRWSNFFWGDIQARRCHRGAAWKIHHEGSSRWRNFVIYFMAYSFHEGLTLAWKHQIRQAGFMCWFFPPLLDILYLVTRRYKRNDRTVIGTDEIKNLPGAVFVELPHR